MNSETQQLYVDALRKGRRDRSQDVAKGGTGRLRTLESLLGDRTIASRTPFAVRDVPIRLVVGTVSEARAVGFSPAFLPVMETRTEFAVKWMHLSEAHLAEGFHTPVKLVEYLGRFYAEEGNKRVSVLKYFKVNSVRGEIVRWTPEYDPDDPAIRLYYEFLDFHRRTGMYAVQLSAEGHYDELYERLRDGLGLDTTECFRHFEAADFEAFRRILHTAAGVDPHYTSGDILLAYLRLYGLPNLDDEETVADRLRLLGGELSARRGTEGERISVEPGAPPPPPTSGLLGVLLGPPRPLRVGFLYAHSPENSLWSLAHEEGRLAAAAALGRRVETVVRNDVPEGLEGAETIAEFAAQGFDAVFATTPAMLSATLKAAIACPSVRFFCCSEAHPYTRVETYFGRMFEPRFLIGVLAGSLSKTGRLGAVATWPVPDVVSGLNAFALGARLVNPRAEVLVEWTCNWEAYSRVSMLEEERMLFAAGADLVSRQSTLQGRGLILRTGLDWSDFPDASLRNVAFPRWNWGVFYERMLRQLAADVSATPLDRYVVRPSATAFWWGLGSGLVDLAIDEETVPDATIRLVNWLRALIAEGRANPFSGPIRDNRGELRVAKGETLGFDGFSSMDWFVEGIATEAPVMEQDQAEDVVR